MATVRDDAGRVLGRCAISVDDDGAARVELLVREGKARLIQHYFLEGKRAVTIDFGDVLLPGLLQTRWSDGARIWSVRLRRPEPAAQAVA
jgi:hypothetical protein